MRPVGIDLFSGAGGFSLGFESAGFDIKAAVDVDPIHCATHAYNFPYCKTICSNALDINGPDIRRLSGLGEKDIAVVFGGPPCQSFSLMGKRSPNDPRTSLIHHFVRLVLELQPAYFVCENVKGLTLGQQRKVLDQMIETLEDGGYSVLLPYELLNAADFGIPQERYRLFLLGALRGRTLPTYPESSTDRADVADALGDLPDVDDYPELIEQDWTEASYGNPSAYARRLVGYVDDTEDFAYRRIYNRTLLTSSLRTTHSDESRRRFSETTAGKIEPISRFYKLDPAGVCNTIRSGTASDRGAFTSPRPIHPNSPRCITNREAARLHSYPDWFRFHVTKWHGFRQIGNSVPPLLARAVAAQIIGVMDVIPLVPIRRLYLSNPALLELTMTQAAERYDVPLIARARRNLDRRKKRSGLSTAVHA